MPAYRTHVSINLAFTLPLSIAALKYSVHLSPAEFAAFTGAFIYGTLFLHPDLDLAANIRLFSFKGLMTLPFRPLSHFLKHRGFSHIPIFGTLFRALWLLLICCILASILKIPELPPNPWNHSLIWLSLFGLITSDISHIILDKIN